MISCDDCRKEFKYPCFLLKHLQRKYPCNPNKNITKKDNVGQCSVNDKVNDKVNDGKCSKHICEKCGKSFNSKQGKHQHKKNVNCKPIEESKPQLQTQNNITTQQNAETINNINNTYAPVYNITYVKETGSMICDNPQLDDNELLCIEGFQREAIINKRLNNMDYPKLNRLTMNVIEYEEYDEFFKFLFRDDKNRRMHFMTLGKNAGATCCEAFRAGKIEKFEKDQFFNRVMGYICGHLTIMNNKFAPLNQLLFSKKSKRSFENALRTPSEHYQLFIEE